MHALGISTTSLSERFFSFAFVKMVFPLASYDVVVVAVVQEQYHKNVLHYLQDGCGVLGIDVF